MTPTRIKKMALNLTHRQKKKDESQKNVSYLSCLTHVTLKGRYGQVPGLTNKRKMSPLSFFSKTKMCSHGPLKSCQGSIQILSGIIYTQIQTLSMWPRPRSHRQPSWFWTRLLFRSLITVCRMRSPPSRLRLHGWPYRSLYQGNGANFLCHNVLMGHLDIITP